METCASGMGMGQLEARDRMFCSFHMLFLKLMEHLRVDESCGETRGVIDSVLALSEITRLAFT
jgi:hypothetical protein